MIYTRVVEKFLDWPRRNIAQILLSGQILGSGLGWEFFSTPCTSLTTFDSLIKKKVSFQSLFLF